MTLWTVASLPSQIRFEYYCVVARPQLKVDGWPTGMLSQHSGNAISMANYYWIAPCVFLIFAFIVFVQRFNPRPRLEKTFFCPEAFRGNCYECRVIGLSFSDGHTICSIGANTSGIYMSRPSNLSRNSWALSWKYGPNIPDLLREPIFIPWENLRYRRTRVVFKEYMRFDLALLKISFIIPLPIAKNLLADAGRETQG